MARADFVACLVLFYVCGHVDPFFETCVFLFVLYFSVFLLHYILSLWSLVAIIFCFRV